MPADFIINADHKVVFSFGWGTMTYQDIISHRERLWKDARFRPEFSQILHFAHVTTMALSHNEIVALARQLVFDSRSRRAMVATTGLHYGLSRVFLAYTQSQTVRVFRDLNEAIEWIGISTEVADAAFGEFRSAHDLA